MMRRILARIKSRLWVFSLTPVRVRLAARSARVQVIIYLSVPLHLNFIRGLIHRLTEDGRFLVIISCAFPKRGIGLPRKAFVLRDPRWIRKIPAKFLLTGDADVPIAHHPATEPVHVTHSLASTHVIYADGAFDRFRYIFCAGPHHKYELHEMLLKRGVRGCTLVPAGYEVVDRLMAEPSLHTQPPTVTFAPSWGPGNALAQHGAKIVRLLLDRYRVVVRPHIQNLRLDSKVLECMMDTHGGNSRFSIDKHADSLPTLLQTDLLISDWSGVAFEYALARLRPVIFIDGPMKVFNPAWPSYLAQPGIEFSYRERIGVVVADVDEIVAAIDRLLDDLAAWQAKIKLVRDELLFNVGNCADASHRALLLMSSGARDPGWAVL